MSSPFSAEELARRVPVWTALADLFRDTEFTDSDAAYVARVLAASGYDTPTLERILRTEVAPTFGWNAISVAGEWAGWNEEVVRDAVLEHLARRRGLTGVPGRVVGRFAGRMAAPHWARVLRELERPSHSPAPW